MPDFLLELRSEEIPARMQVKAKADLERLFVDALAKAGLVAEQIEAFATPRRLALIAHGLPLATQAISEETKGPKVGAPPQALEGFLRKTGLTQDQLTERDGVYFAVIDKPGRATADVLAEAIPGIVRSFPWPKAMRWGAASLSTESLRWVRPLQGIVALLDDDVVPCEVDGITSGRETMGHRFHSSGSVSIADPSAYVETLRAAHVIIHFSERCRIIRDGAAKAAADAGLVIVEDKALVIENAGLTEWPVPLLGRFDAGFLDVPPEVIQLTARMNQKYFVCHDASGALTNAFVCTSNIDAHDGGAAIIAGNEKVLAARLADAKFFWEADLKVPLDVQAEKLSQIVFHEKLGTVAERVDRIAAVAADWLPEMIGWPEAKVRAMQPRLRAAARNAKIDLVSNMVGEFPELQGVMGGHYTSGLGNDISEAIRDQYKPAGPADALPSGEVGTLLALADKADALFGFFSRGMPPTGSKDPFALRRAAIGIIRLIIENELRLSLLKLFSAVDWASMFVAQGVQYSDPSHEIVAFIIDRLKVQQREAGVRHDLIDAVFALGGEDDLVRLLARVKALQGFVETGEGADLLAAYKRATKIIAQTSAHIKLGDIGDHSSDADEAALEQSLKQHIGVSEPLVAAAIDNEQFEEAMKLLASLKAPIYAFMDSVLVFHPDADVARRRLDLLRRFRDAVHNVADFSKIEG